MNDGVVGVATVRPVVVAPGAGERLTVLGAPMVVKSDATRLAVFFAEHEVAPGYAVPPHIHHGEDELFYVLEGELTVRGPDSATRAGPGTTVLLPRGGVHSFANEGIAPVRFLVVAAQGRQAAAMFRELDGLGRAGPPAPEQVMATCARHGVDFA